MRKKYFVFFYFLIVCCFPFFGQTNMPISSSMVKAEETRVFFQFGTGIAYDFDFGTEFLSNSANRVFFDVPLFFEVDIRMKKRFSITTGVAFTYNLKYYVNGDYDIYKNSLFIDIPLNFKFYPMAAKDDRYDSFYVGGGLFFRAWAVNTYAAYSSDREHCGNAYDPESDVVPAGSCFMPCNVGIAVFLGNILRLNERAGLGIDLSLRYTFLPYENGYLSDPQTYGTSENVLLGFWGDIGMRFFVRFLLNNKGMQYRF